MPLYLPSAIAALTESIPTAETVREVLTDIVSELQTQENIDEDILARLQALETAVVWIGD